MGTREHGKTAQLYIHTHTLVGRGRDIQDDERAPFCLSGCLNVGEMHLHLVATGGALPGSRWASKASMGLESLMLFRNRAT